MAYPPRQNYPPKEEKPTEVLVKVLVLVVLVVVLLVVLTKLKFMHSKDIPGWKGFYCGVIEQGKQSKIMVLYGDEGLGDPELLVEQLSRFRVSAPALSMHINSVSTGTLKSFELVILEKARKLTFTQAAVLEAYMDGGGSIIWIGDAGSEYVLSEEDRQWALMENETLPYSYEALVNRSRRATGFDEIGRQYLGVNFLRVENGSSGVVLKVVDRSNPLMEAVVQELELHEVPFAVVRENAVGAAGGITKSAVIAYGGHDYPAVLDSKYVGRIVYVAFPPEQVTQSNQPGGLLTNMVDYLVNC
ncbi:TPA: hypothetical protein HA318_03730 [Candidatus Micrarchaeota archaeon]|nr:MAG: hypothetical protein AUJ65_05670 [Candidatus Micrarchaeota archaeon CG1_02_51_15]HII39083.1 hypothetical protein [Candidatus Micrarchaeota archaeon]